MVPVARTEIQRTSNIQPSKKLMLMQLLLSLLVGITIVANLSQLAFAKTSNSPRLSDEGEERHGSLYNYDARATTVRKEWQAIQYDKKLSMYKKLERREVMVKTNPDSKHDEVNMVKENKSTSVF
jgi:hypothetical protein